MRRACLRSLFIKREKLFAKSTTTGTESFDPRPIQAVGDLANCLLGPWMYAFSKSLCVLWNIKFIICYAAGMTAEAMGRWMSTAEDDGFLWSLEIDHTRYDSSLCLGALVFE